jgi:hypothetical protein
MSHCVTLRYFATMSAVMLFSVVAARAEAAIESRNILKTYFETGDKPTQQQFSNLIDSYVHQTDDGLTLYAFGVAQDSSGENFLRVGGNVGINETLPDTKLHKSAWRTAPVPNIPPIPGMCPSFCGLSGFLPLQYVGPDGTSLHYGFLEIRMEAAGGIAMLGGGGVADDGPAIFVANWAWETTPDATITTFFTPEPASAALLAMPLALTAFVRRRSKQ